MPSSAISPAQWSAAALDPAVLGRLALGHGLDDWQADFCRRAAAVIPAGPPPVRAVVVCARQSGKTTGAAVAAAHRAWTRPGSVVLAVGPTQQHSANVVQRVRQVAELLPGDGQPAASSRTRLELRNRSVVVGLPGDTPSSARGWTADLVICDELGWFKAETWEALQSTVDARNGGIVGCSTPNGRQGPLGRVVSGSAGRWDVTTVTADDVPRLDRAMLDERRAILGRERFSVEYECQFIGSSTSAFTPRITAERDVDALAGGYFDRLRALAGGAA